MRAGKFIPVAGFTNVTALGYGAKNDRDNQVTLGDARTEQVRTVGTMQVGAYTPATLPPAALHTGAVAYITGGLGGGQNECMVFSDGINWRKIENGDVQA